MWDATIFLTIMRSLLVPVKHDLIVGGRGGGQARVIAKHKTLPSTMWRDVPDPISRLTSFSIEERGSRTLL